ncbi:MAG: 1-hydroxycarotenoid 3,4-desaturase CrtD [Gemmobacter sp.]
MTSGGNTGRRRVVVIGAGIGGLAAAVRLAHGGAAVTVVEAAPGPGGKLRTLPSAAGPVDAGPTVLTLRRVFDDLFAAAGTQIEDHLRLVPQPVLARHWWPDGTRLDLHADADATAQAIRDWAGARAERDFERFHAATARAFAAFDGPVMQAPRVSLTAVARAAVRSPSLWPMLAPGMTLHRYLALSFREPRLRQLFGRFATYVGGTPRRSPAVLSLIWQAEARGVHVVEGGMHRLAEVLEGLARQGGAVFRYNVGAERILEHWGRVSGVALRDGSTLPAEDVVFNGDPAALVQGLLGRAVAASVAPRRVRPRSLSARVWAFAARPRGADLSHHNVFFTDDPDAEFLPLSRGQAPSSASHYICAQDRGTGGVPPALERFEVIQNAPAQSVPAQNAPATDEEDSRCHAMMTAHFARMGLIFDPPPDPTSMTGPQGFARMFPGSGGAIYGLSPQGLTASFRRPVARTVLPGLWLAGGGVHPGAGVPMAALSGLHAAEAILADPPSLSRWAQAAMPGGTSTASPTTGAARSRSSGS